MSLHQRFVEIRKFYEAVTPRIMAVEPWMWGAETFILERMTGLSPIEEAFWGDIRMEGVVLYPQYPVAGYFLDFAHPKVKVAIECDGQKWHMDRLKDRQRDAELHNLGWTVYRLTGKQCWETTQESFDSEGREQYELSRPTLLLRQLGKRYRICSRYREAA